MDATVIRNKVKALLEQMNRGAMEREEVMGLSLLAAMAGESIFLLGLPGVGKSMVARRLKDAFSGARSFEYLMSRFSTPDEIFGPVSISKLKDEDTYERVTDGYLPSADIVFLDEIWKAGPAIQNSLLTAINEKIFRNGERDMTLPLIGLISASNELPAEGEGLEALWDRFIIRYIVSPINDRSSFKALITGKSDAYKGVDENAQLTRSEWESLQREAENVDIPSYIVDLIANLRSKYIVRMNRRYSRQEDNGDEEQRIPYVSDRRWKKIVGILRMSALLNGRSEVDLSDCMLLEHMIWDDDSEIPQVCSDVQEEVAKGVFKRTARTMLSRNPEKSTAPKADPYMLTKDGCYVIEAGAEKIMISKEDYESVVSGPCSARFEGKDRIVLCSEMEHGCFPVKVATPGTLSVRNFSYKLKRSPAETVKSRRLNYLNEVDNDVEEKIIMFKGELEENFFTRDMDSYVTLGKYFSRYLSDAAGR